MLRTHTARFGAYPTMITPYDAAGHIDRPALERLVKWYWDAGCDGIFASCQSSEIAFLSEDDRVSLAQWTKEAADCLAASDSSRKPMTIVASGHVSDTFEDQVRELKRIGETGVDAVILITNRLDIKNTSEEAWIRDAERLIEALPEDLPLGLYECPKPYKRLLTPGMLKWCLSTGRFRFIKDTCCSAETIEDRMKILRGSDLLLFNANAQTLLESLKSGAAGYCGIMCNFHPKLYLWLTHFFKEFPEKAEEVETLLSMMAFTEQLAYPITAKYHLSELEGLNFGLFAHSCPAERFSAYDMLCMRQMKALADQKIKEVCQL